jgi:hypothetical protein
VEELPRFAVEEAMSIKSYKVYGLTPCTLIWKQCFGRKKVTDNITDMPCLVILWTRSDVSERATNFYFFLW